MRDVQQTIVRRRLPVGAEPLAGGGVHFRVWAPDHKQLELVLEDGAAAMPMTAEEGGYFTAHSASAEPGTLYRYRLTDGTLAPDPASRYQPSGPRGPSAVVDPEAFPWTDQEWTGVTPERQVVYELHVGTFTRAGTWRAAAEELSELALLGVTVIEMMPVAEFPGRFNWGYDGVLPFAPAHVYGTPDDLRALIDAAHGHGMAVILDVVYNHLGPDACYLPNFARSFFSRTHTTEWGDALNFDGDGSAGVREYFLANVEYWIDEFHFDGLRLDATQNIYDDSSPHILQEIATRAREAAGDRRVWMVAENEPQDTRLVQPTERGGFGLDAMWNDDFHHSAMVALLGHAEAYYSDHRGTPQEFVSAAKWGFLFQGQYYKWQKQRRGTPSFGLPGRVFVSFLQNHDQIANSADGKRGHQLASAGDWRAVTALLLLLPGPALLFQGQEFTASSPFLFFADHVPDLARRVFDGRREYLSQFPSAARPDVLENVADPADETTFVRCKLDWSESRRNADVLRLHRDLITLSRTDPVFAAQDATNLHGAVLSDRAFLLRYITANADDRLLLVNLGPTLRPGVVPEPLLAPPRGMRWRVLWSSDDPAYGGRGFTEPEHDDGWVIAGRSTVALVPRPLASPVET
jgi:maltooligosyltrehalose trehalohydrolase